MSSATFMRGSAVILEVCMQRAVAIQRFITFLSENREIFVLWKVEKTSRRVLRNFKPRKMLLCNTYVYIVCIHSNIFPRGGNSSNLLSVIIDTRYTGPVDTRYAGDYCSLCIHIYIHVYIHR